MGKPQINVSWIKYEYLLTLIVYPDLSVYIFTYNH